MTTLMGKQSEDQEGNDGHDDNDGMVKIEAGEPLAATRSRRSNAGNRMGHLIQEEEDEFYRNLYGGFDEEEDDGDFDCGEEADEDDDDDDADGDSDAYSSSSRDDDMDEIEPKHQVVKHESRKKSSPKESKPRIQHISTSEEPSSSLSVRQKCFKDFLRICSVCLSSQSDEDDEIIECDSCGVTVHESCYGVTGEDIHSQDNVSVHSNLSSESTEPWFCEPCKRSVYEPRCELCPNSGGIFKETDTGRWVHMVCALYTRGVTFENIHNLTDVSLFELNYSLFGSKVSQET